MQAAQFVACRLQFSGSHFGLGIIEFRRILNSVLIG